MYLYRNILKQALNIAWHNKYLWFFGLFAVLLGNGGIYDILIRGFSGNKSEKFFSSIQRISETGFFSLNTLTNIPQFLKTEPLAMIILFIIGLVILASICFLIWLMVVSQIALVNNSSIIIGNKEKKLGIRDGITSGTKNFWPVLWLNIINKIILYIIFLLLGLLVVGIVSKYGSLSINILYIILFIVFIPFAIIISFIIKYAVAYIIIKGDSLMMAIKKGLELFIKNWLISVEMALILFFINFVFGLAIILCVLIITVPFIFLAVLFYKLLSIIGFWLIASIGLIILLFIIMSAGAFLATFQIASWTKLFLELINKGGISKILRIFNKE